MKGSQSLPADKVATSRHTLIALAQLAHRAAMIDSPLATAAFQLFMLALRSFSEQVRSWEDTGQTYDRASVLDTASVRFRLSAAERA